MQSQRSLDQHDSAPTFFALTSPVLNHLRARKGASPDRGGGRLNDLARIGVVQGKEREGEPLMKHALAICKQGLGRKHFNTRICRKNYAFLLQTIGRDAEAK